jgi:rubrerythrin
MNIYDFAIKMEKDSESYYLELAGKCNNAGLKNILMMLADDEKKHQEIVSKMKSNANVEVTETKILNNAKNIFQEMKDKKEKIEVNIKQKDLYIKAEELEKKSEDFYLEKSKEAENEKHKEIFLILAGEEKKHFFLLYNIQQFVSHPDYWVENAEFHHLDSEEY